MRFGVRNQRAMNRCFAKLPVNPQAVGLRGGGVLIGGARHALFAIVEDIDVSGNARPPACQVSAACDVAPGSRCAASRRRISLCSLESGTARFFDLFRQPSCAAIALDAQAAGDRERIRDGRRRDRPAAPEREGPEPRNACR